MGLYNFGGYLTKRGGMKLGFLLIFFILGIISRLNLKKQKLPMFWQHICIADELFSMGTFDP